MKRKQVRNLVIGLSLLLTFTLSVGTTAPLFVQANTQSAPIKILFVMDQEYGYCYNPIRAVFERFGWNITTTALEETIISCDYDHNIPLDVDILLTEITDVTEYDIVTIMPGSSHDLLRTNETALDLIREAVSENLIVTAWCRAVRVLAAADVIDGKNVTGNAEYQAEYEAAGATFFELVPPIIDGNIVTSVRSTYYREETCIAIATAVGFFESNEPTLTSTSISPSPSALNIDTILTANFFDETSVHIVNCKIFALNSIGERALVHSYFETMNSTETVGQFDCVIRDLVVGNYTVDLFAWDCFMNYNEFIDATEFTILEELPTTNTTQEPDLLQWVLPGAMIGGAIVVIGVLVVIMKRR